MNCSYAAQNILLCSLRVPSFLLKGPIEVQLYDPHYPCISCVGSIKQFIQRHPHASFVHGFDDWRNLQNVLRDERYTKRD